MIQINCRDCVEALNNWTPTQKADVIVTSPPYNLGIQYGKYNDKIPREEYLKWMDVVAQAIYKVLSDEGSLFINLGSSPSDQLIPFQVLTVLTKYFKLQNSFHWIKSITIPMENKDKSFGHFKPINSERFVNDCHEYVFHLTKTGNVKLNRRAIGVPYEDKSNIDRWKNTEGNDLRCRGNNWFIPYKTVQSKKKHPASFPPELPEMCFKLHGTGKIKLALDPFNGIGNSAIAAQKLGLDFIGYDIDEEYCYEANEIIGWH